MNMPMAVKVVVNGHTSFYLIIAYSECTFITIFRILETFRVAASNKKV